MRTRAPVCLAATSRTFAGHEGGSVAITFGLTAVALMLSMGLAVDMGLSLNARTKLSQAIDVAVLSAAKASRDYNLDATETKTLALSYVESLVKDMSKEFSTLQTPDIQVNPDTGQIDITLTAIYQTRFGGIIGIPTFTIQAQGAALISGNDVEVGMQLDVTGSMGQLQGGVVKIDALKNSAKKAIDILIPDKKGKHTVRVGYAPFAEAVNAGTFANAVSNGNSTKCTLERNNINDQATDLAPAGSDALKKGSSCPSATVMPLSDDKAKLKAGIDTLALSGSTAGHLGAAWAWYLVSPNWAGIWGGTAPAPYGDGKTLKFAIMMTDGIYNTFGGVNKGDTSTTATQSQQYAVSTCTAMKAKGITIYTVGFGDSITGTAKTTLQSCASDPSKFFLALNQSDLDAAFESVARDIVSLRLSK